MLAYWKDEDGLATVEYALLLALIVVVALTAWVVLHGSLASNVNTTIEPLD